MSNAIFNLNSARSMVSLAEANLIDEIPKVAPDAKFKVKGAVMTAPEYLELLKRHRDTMAVTDQRRAALHASVAEEEALRVAIRDGGVGFRGYIVGTFGIDSPEYIALGLADKPRAEVDVATKSAAADKLRATRAARHTMGRRQRTKVHGTVAASTTAAEPEVSAPAAPAVVTAGR